MAEPRKLNLAEVMDKVRKGKFPVDQQYVNILLDVFFGTQNNQRKLKENFYQILLQNPKEQEDLLSYLKILKSPNNLQGYFEISTLSNKVESFDNAKKNAELFLRDLERLSNVTSFTKDDRLLINNLFNTTMQGTVIKPETKVFLELKKISERDLKNLQKLIPNLQKDKHLLELNIGNNQLNSLLEIFKNNNQSASNKPQSNAQNKPLPSQPKAAVKGQQNSSVASPTKRPLPPNPLFTEPKTSEPYAVMFDKFIKAFRGLSTEVLGYKSLATSLLLNNLFINDQIISSKTQRLVLRTNEETLKGYFINANLSSNEVIKLNEVIENINPEDYNIRKNDWQILLRVLNGIFPKTINKYSK